MKRKLVIGLLSGALLIGGTTTALGATDSSALDDIKSLYQQMFSLQNQIVQKEVEAGAITQEQGDFMQKSMELRQKYQDQAIDNGQVFSPGMGMGRHGMWRTNNGVPLTDEQTQALNDYMKQRLELHQKALEDGTLVPSQGMGMRGGYGHFGGGAWGAQAPSGSSTSTNESTI